MPITREQYTSNYQQSTITLNSVKNGSLLVVAVTGSTGTCSISTTSGSTGSWTSAGSVALSATSIFIYYAYVTAAGTVTVTQSGTLSDPGMSMHEYSGIVSSSPQDGSVQQDDLSGGGSDHAIDTPSIETSQADTALFAVYANEGTAETITPATGWSQVTWEGGHVHGTFDRIVTSQGSYDFQGTLSGSGWIAEWLVLFVAFKGAGGALPFPPLFSRNENTLLRR